MAIYRLKNFSDLVSAVRDELLIPSSDTLAIQRIKRDINIVYDDVAAFSNWTWLRGTTEATVQPYYGSTGTVSVTRGSPTVTLSSAISISQKGSFFSVHGQSETYKIAEHTAGSTTITLESVYTGVDATAQSFRIWRGRIILPVEAREVMGVSNTFHSTPMTAYGWQEFRRVQAQSPKSEGRPFCYTVTDYEQPNRYETVSGMPTSVTAAADGLLRTLVLSASAANYLQIGNRVELSGSSVHQFNGQYVISSVSGTTVTYTGKSEFYQIGRAHV